MTAPKNWHLPNYYYLLKKRVKNQLFAWFGCSWFHISYSDKEIGCSRADWWCWRSWRCWETYGSWLRSLLLLPVILD